jgi:hypothetical protein
LIETRHCRKQRLRRRAAPLRPPAPGCAASDPQRFRALRATVTLRVEILSSGLPAAVGISHLRLRTRSQPARLVPQTGRLRSSARCSPQTLFTITATATLAPGMAASTAIFSVVFGVLMPPLPFDRPRAGGLHGSAR